MQNSRDLDVSRRDLLVGAAATAAMVTVPSGCRRRPRRQPACLV